jgi:hypothetical protein
MASTYSIFNKAPQAPIILDNESDSDHLTTLESGDTPTLDDSEAPSIKALNEAQAAHDDAAFNLVVARMPSDHRIKIGYTHYVRYNPYRSRKSKRKAWYWNADQAEELIITSKGCFSYITLLEYN